MSADTAQSGPSDRCEQERLLTQTGEAGTHTQLSLASGLWPITAISRFN